MKVKTQAVWQDFITFLALPLPLFNNMLNPPKMC